MPDPAPHPGQSTDGGQRAMIGVILAILVVAALDYAGAVLAPLAFALFAIAIVWPVQARLERFLPKLLALAITMFTTIVAISLFGSLIAWGFSRVGRYIAGDAARLQLLYSQAVAMLESHDIAVAGLWAEHFNVAWLLRLFQQVSLRINGMVSFSVVVGIYLILGLLEVGSTTGKLRSLGAGVLLAGSAQSASKLRRYFVVRSMMSLMTGVLVWGFATATGLPLAAEWGVMAFALNYIPFIGPLMATVLPTAFAALEFETWQMVVVVFACLNLIQFLVGSYLEPLVAGSILSMSPFLVLFAVFFWTFLWGIAGAFIGVPIVIAALTICAQHPSSRWVAELCGAGGKA